jgi:predicted CopG family antitoxin
MVSKNISISKDVYNLLQQLKLEGESFSDTIRRLALSKGKINEFFGLWKDMPEDEFQNIIENINSIRNQIDNEIFGDKNP